MMEMGLKLDYIVDINVLDSEIVSRLSGRRVCPACEMSYHIKYKQPMKEGICDGCGTVLVQRNDDTVETIVNRLKAYHNQTEPLIEYYKTKGKLIVVNGKGNISDTTKETFKVLGINE
jgi:adenylate kinase